EVAGEAHDSGLWVDQREGAWELCSEPGDGGACWRDRWGLGGRCLDRWGEVLEAGEVVRSSGARYRVDQEAVPRVGEDHRLVLVAVQGGVKHCGSDCVAPSSCCDDQPLHAVQPTGSGLDHSPYSG